MKKPYPINVNGLIRKLEEELECQQLDEKQKQVLKGFLAQLYSLKHQGIEQTDSSKISLKDLMEALGFTWRDLSRYWVKRV